MRKKQKRRLSQSRNPLPSQAKRSASLPGPACRGSLIHGGCGPMPGAKRWSCCEIPSGFGRDLASLHSPEAAFWIDGAMPFRGETAKGYVNGLLLRFAQDLVTERFGPNVPSNVYAGSVNIENRFRYNQAFKSVFSMV